MLGHLRRDGARTDDRRQANGRPRNPRGPMPPGRARTLAMPARRRAARKYADAAARAPPRPHATWRRAGALPASARKSHTRVDPAFAAVACFRRGARRRKPALRYRPCVCYKRLRIVGVSAACGPGKQRYPMLLRFGVSNALSIRDFQELLLTASSLKDPDAGLIACPSAPTGYVVPAAAIYGANAAGKTNLCEAIDAMRRMVLYSHTRGEPDGGVPRHPFRLDPKCKAGRSRFEMDFVIDNVRYLYGFEPSDAAFESEGLYASRKA